MRFTGYRKGAAALALGLLILAGCGPEAVEPAMQTGGMQTTGPMVPATSAETQPADPLRELLAEMTLEEKVGQLFFVQVDALDPSQTALQINDSSAVGVTELSQPMRLALETYPVGGVVLFQKNIQDPDQLTAFTAALGDAMEIGLFIAVDEEGGAVARIANHPSFQVPRYDSAAAVGSGEDPQAALEMGTRIGEYLAQYGFNMDFAPVADVNTNPDNPIIGDRAFSSEPETAARMASAMAQGLKSRGILAVYKHFPGHGDTAEDSHQGLAVSHKTREEMRSCEWLPYTGLTELDCVMVGHIAVPNITGNMVPATMSKAVLQGILRQELGFDGLILTDSLDMGAITQRCSAGEAAVAALEAGCDMLLGPEDLGEAFQAVLGAVRSGRVSMERLEESVWRILRLKKEAGLLAL